MDAAVSSLSLLLPTVLSAVALFFLSFLSWMVVQLHAADWRKLPHEDELREALRKSGINGGNFMFPGVEQPAEGRSPEFQQKVQQGPTGVLTVFGSVNMARNLALTMLYFLVTSYCLGYLATLGIPRGAEFFTVFRFVATAGLLTHLSSILSHAIWFHCRVVGHGVESIVYALTLGFIFGALWPA